MRLDLLMKLHFLLLNTVNYGVATIIRLLKNVGFFCKRALQKRSIFCKETYIVKDPTDRSHLIGGASYSRLLKNTSLFSKIKVSVVGLFCKKESYI